MSKRSKFFYWVPSLLWMGVIFSLSSRPSLTKSYLVAKSGHFFEYAFLAFLFSWALANTTSFNKRLIFALAVLLAALYGASDELHQLYVPTRGSDFDDVLIDSLSAVAGTVAFFSMRLLSVGNKNE